MTPKPRAQQKPVAKKPRRERLTQIREALSATAKSDPKFIPIIAGTFLGVFAVLLLIGFLVGHPIIVGILAVSIAALAAMTIAGRRASSMAFGRIEGQPGAAYAVLGSMRGDWRVTQAVEFTKNYDLVHRVLGHPGVILVAEGSGSRPRELIGTHARKVRRVVGDTPIYDVVVGDGEGEVPLRKLQAHLVKLPRNLKGKELNALESRLKALGGAAMPIPKGPMPRGKIR
ncbi:MAG: hypothetical protein QOG49_136 [Frankiaceae bacterium]|jgi:hypothetical protein|nr:hypothetical protein [Frankiaceae bacterium]